MQISGLSASNTFSATDALAIEVNVNGTNKTYKLTGATLAAALAAIGSYLKMTDVVNNLTIGGTTVPLSAEMGKTLNDIIGITELSSATSLVTLISNMGNLTIRHYFTVNKNNLTDFPQALIDVGAIYYIHIDIEKRGGTIANVTITAVDSANHPVTIAGEYYSGTLYWGLTTDALNDKIATQDISSNVTSSKGTFSLKQVHTILDAVFVTVELTLTSQVSAGQTIITGLPKAKGNYVNISIKHGQTLKLAYMNNNNLAAGETLSSGEGIAINYSYIKQ